MARRSTSVTLLRLAYTGTGEGGGGCDARGGAASGCARAARAPRQAAGACQAGRRCEECTQRHDGHPAGRSRDGAAGGASRRHDRRAQVRRLSGMDLVQSRPDNPPQQVCCQADHWASPAMAERASCVCHMKLCDLCSTEDVANPKEVSVYIHRHAVTLSSPAMRAGDHQWRTQRCWARLATRERPPTGRCVLTGRTRMRRYALCASPLWSMRANDEQ